MNIRILSIAELKEFVESDTFATLTDIPITPLRALSQYHNPKAKPADPALIVATNEKSEVIAYAGCLPDQLGVAPNEKICWNSCWWAHPQKGREVAMPVFYKALQLWEGKMLFDGLTPRSEAILRRFKFIHCLEITGVRGFLRLNFNKVFLKRFPRLKFLSKLIQSGDGVINFLMEPRFYFWRKKLAKTPLSIQQVFTVDQEVDNFIQQHSDSYRNQLIQRSAEDFNWILKYPWLDEYKNGQGPFQKKYYFSAHASKLENRLLVVRMDIKIIAFTFLTYRDGVVKLPYVYFEDDYLDDVFPIILHQLLLLKAETFVTFHPQLIQKIKENPSPFFHIKTISKTIGIPEVLKKYYDQTPVIQDGDGDVVFT